MNVAIADVVASLHTVIVYEAPSRTAATLAALAEAGAGSREAVVARELTKQFEEFRRGTVAELAAYYAGQAPRGEIVIVIEGAPVVTLDEATLAASAAAWRAEGLSARDIQARLIAQGALRNLAYRLAHQPA